MDVYPIHVLIAAHACQTKLPARTLPAILCDWTGCEEADALKAIELEVKSGFIESSCPMLTLQGYLQILIYVAGTGGRELPPGVPSAAFFAALDAADERQRKVWLDAAYRVGREMALRRERAILEAILKA